MVTEQPTFSRNIIISLKAIITNMQTDMERERERERATGACLDRDREFLDFKKQPFRQ